MVQNHCNNTHDRKIHVEILKEERRHGSNRSLKLFHKKNEQFISERANSDITVG